MWFWFNLLVLSLGTGSPGLRVNSHGGLSEPQEIQSQDSLLSGRLHLRASASGIE